MPDRKILSEVEPTRVFLAADPIFDLWKRLEDKSLDGHGIVAWFKV
ncbi:Hypothetical protein CpMEX30_1732 [Corynebacterium pseudotuberculosis]|nr:Hypothetical protein CpE19_1664 [Corynebacterium pseudotuberculosis]APQ54741.1 Hypothetical protein CpMEX30_1732 [Corynebacterium pseudotuberculosis]APQ56820.1 Hypothetical protein CpMEX31_1723 [Corynebacterium pseudotuberculosis]ATB62628.1 Hypothetical protein BFF96_1754 [Corynebacterium pseudotuberculosis]ATV79408.1 Hypothetical protein BFF97_00647 [Corynebacterium pseudotuberculosis]